MGISMMQAGKKGGPMVVTKNERQSEAEASLVGLLAAREILDFARELEANQRDGKPIDVATRQRLLEKIEQLQSLNAVQLGILLGEFRSASGIDDQTRRGLVSFAMHTLANTHPEAALELFLNDTDLREIGGLGEAFLSSTMSSWAGANPVKALTWLRTNEGKHPALVTDAVRVALVTGVSKQDMRSAFGLLSEFGLEKPDDALAKIASSADSPERRTDFISLLRKHENLSMGKEMPEGVVATLAHGIGQDGFEVGTGWLTQSKLTAEELTRMADFIVRSAKGGEQGKWIGWLGEKLPADSRDDKVYAAMTNWTQKDHRAAGEWLAAAPEGSVRNAAVKGFVGAVAEYDPQVATQWALTLPPGEQRESSLQLIHEKMPQGTEVQQRLRDEFSREHGTK